MSDGTRLIERTIIREVIKVMDDAGFAPVQFHDGEAYQPVIWRADTMVPGTALARRTASAIKCIESVDMGTLHFAPKGDLKNWGATGVMFILGNGMDVIHDWHSGNASFSRAMDRALTNIEELDT
jgi:hypothetical protein